MWGLRVAVVAAIILAGGIGMAVFLKQQQRLNDLQRQLTLAQQHAGQLESEKEEFRGQIESLQKDRTAADERVASLRAQLAASATDLETARKNLKDLQARHEALAQEHAGRQERLAGLARELEESRAQAQRLEEDKSDLQRSVTRLRGRLAWLDRDYRQLVDKLAQAQPESGEAANNAIQAGPSLSAASSASASAVRPSASAMVGTVELPPIIVRKDQVGMATPIRGRVLEVNESNHFIVVDKGSMDGVRLGLIFEILRGGTSVGRATVARLRPRLSACELIRAARQGTILVGDLVVESGR